MGNYLITGGCGFIGSTLIEKLISNGSKLFVIDNLSTGKISNLPKSKKITFLKKSVQNISTQYRKVSVAAVSANKWQRCCPPTQTMTSGLCVCCLLLSVSFCVSCCLLVVLLLISLYCLIAFLS